MAVVCSRCSPDTRSNAVDMTTYSDFPSRQTLTANKRPCRSTTEILHAYLCLLFLLVLIVGYGSIAFDRRVSNMVEKAIEKHAADGIARVDYAAASWGATVEDHSVTDLKSWWNSKGSRPIEMLSPSFGEPGRCFALQGSSGFVVVKLSEPIVPEAVSLEHVLASVVDDRSDAPKDCIVTAWLQKCPFDGRHNELVLAEFSYDLEKGNVQTFDVSKVVASAGEDVVVNMVKLQFGSNHGSEDSTCIYRFRVHGHKPLA